LQNNNRRERAEEYRLQRISVREINRKNRELRVQIKSMLKEETGGRADKNVKTKRELIKQRNYLM
jgi:U3 small nucleolar RNA-associated protein 14